MYNTVLITLTFLSSFSIFFCATLVISAIIILACCTQQKKTTSTIEMKRGGSSDRKVNDFIRSILIEDDNQYDLLNTTPDKLGNTYKDAFTYDYPRLTYDPKHHKEMVMNNNKYY